MSDEKDAAAEAPKSNKMLMMIVALAMVLLGGGGVGAFFMLRGDSASAAEEKPVKGAVVAIENPLTVNLAEGHYLKFGFALQMTEKAGEEEVDTNEALNLAIEQYTGRTVAELSTQAGRDKIKADLLEKIEKAYEKDDEQMVMDLYYTSFVTQ
ncbi:flagellar basal body-associated FliL family protein [Actinoplanes flavus]|uniref:Flagellar protein FliL n=1 Tax=Actinoplanes flavus TaxID=2820290 RepID=A0ABS3UQA1_9ACTN|nr:flagellar basal body-associated FliL family protein [Actinoplanes flavus]MBO3740621.1 flagellar basal body-associated FliL family protein [Actinoplanes flavus]